MRQLLAMIATALLLLLSGACGGGTGKVASSSSSGSHTGTDKGTSDIHAPVATPRSYSRNDGDKDFDDARGYRDNSKNDDRTLFATYGKRANPNDARAVTALVKRYYAAAAAGDGARACSLLDSSLADALAPEQRQSAPATREACARAISPLLHQQHQHLIADDVSTMVVTSIHVKGNLGLAALGFRTMPEGEIVVEREGKAWKVDALFDGAMT
jgi:hypothetical protein